MTRAAAPDAIFGGGGGTAKIAASPVAADYTATTALVGVAPCVTSAPRVELSCYSSV